MSKGVRAKFGLSSIGPGLEGLKKALHAINMGDAYVVAGVTGSKATSERPDGLTNVGLALIHEFGAPEVGVPQRSFILASYRKHHAEYRAMLATAVKRSIVAGVASGLAAAQEYTRLLSLIGLKMSMDMKAFVVGGTQVPPPNAPATLARKLAQGKWKGKNRPALDEFGRLENPDAPGSPRTLVDTGRLVGSITWELRGAGKDPA